MFHLTQIPCLCKNVSQAGTDSWRIFFLFFKLNNQTYLPDRHAMQNKYGGAPPHFSLQIRKYSELQIFKLVTRPQCLLDLTFMPAVHSRWCRRTKTKHSNPEYVQVLSPRCCLFGEHLSLFYAKSELDKLRNGWLSPSGRSC